MNLKKMCMMCMILSPNCRAVTIFKYSTTEVMLPSCLSVPSEHVASQSKWHSADFDFLKVVKKMNSVWPALFQVILGLKCTARLKVNQNTRSLSLSENLNLEKEWLFLFWVL